MPPFLPLPKQLPSIRTQNTQTGVELHTKLVAVVVGTLAVAVMIRTYMIPRVS